MLHGVLQAFGMKREVKKTEYTAEELRIASKALAPAQSGAELDKTLRELSVKAGPALPIMVGKDPGLVNFKPEFDLGKLKVRNHERHAEAMRKRLGLKD